MYIWGLISTSADLKYCLIFRRSWQLALTCMLWVVIHSLAVSFLSLQLLPSSRCGSNFFPSLRSSVEKEIHSWIILTHSRLKDLMYYAEIRSKRLQPQDFQTMWTLEIYPLTCDALCIWTDWCFTGISPHAQKEQKKVPALVFKVLHLYSVRHAFLFDNSVFWGGAEAPVLTWGPQRRAWWSLLKATTQQIFPQIASVDCQQNTGEEKSPSVLPHDLKSTTNSPLNTL